MQIIAPPKRSKRRSRDGRPAARGVALIFVITTIAILTAVGVDFSYNSRVNLELSVQSRDSLRARSLAVSAMNVARLVLHFQQQIDQATAQLGGILKMLLNFLPGMDPTPLEMACAQAGLPPQIFLQALGATLQTAAANGSTTAAAGTSTTSTTPTTPSNPLTSLLGPAAGGGGGGPSISLWRVAEKFDSNMIFNFLAAFPTDANKKKDQAMPPLGPDKGGAVPIEANFGEFSGTFDIKITDEDQKINVARFGALDTSGAPLATALELYPMINHPTYDFIFNEEDANHDKVSRNDFMTSIRNWVEPSTQSWRFDPAAITGTTATTSSPFIQGGGDDSGSYARYKPRYKPKHAKFDSLDELRMVYGVNDNFMSAFGDRLTVYPDMNAKLNVNTNDPDQLRADLLAVARDPLNPILQNPALIQIIMMQINLRRHNLPFIGLTTAEFLGMIQADGIALRPELLNPNSPANFVDSKSTVFRVVTTGYAGRVKKTLTAVIRYDTGLGQVIYWHED